MSTRRTGRWPLEDFFNSRIRAVCHQAEFAINTKGIASPWLRGYFRELLVRELLQPLIPHSCRLATGTVIAAEKKRGRLAQDDILLVDGECLPPAFEVMGNGMYPVESVLARFEVKTALLSNRQIRQVVEAAEAFWKLEPMMVEVPEKTNDPAQEPPDPRPLQILFVFQDVPRAQLKYLRARLDELMETCPKARFFFCVPGKRLWVYARPYPKETKAERWYQCDLSDQGSGDQYPEVLSLIALLLQELPPLRELRRKGARLSRYIRCLRQKKLVLLSNAKTTSVRPQRRA